jgi:DNA-binding GntR family transcriptional regulator
MLASGPSVGWRAVGQGPAGRPVADGEALMGDRAHDRLIACLRDGSLAAGEFLSIPGLVELLDLPLAATREAVKRADASGLLRVVPKRGVRVMDASPKVTRDCMDLRMMLDAEGARRLIAAKAELPLAELRASHLALIEDSERELTPELPQRAVLTDLSLHDALSAGLGNPVAAAAYQVNRVRIAVVQNSRPFLPDRIVPAMHEHLAIIDAIDRRDAEATVAAIGAHHRTTLRWWGILEP